MKPQMISGVAAGLLALAVLPACETYSLDLPPQTVVEAHADDVVDDRELIVLVNTQTALTTLSREVERRGYRVRGQETLSGLNLYMLTLIIPEGMSGGAAIREVESIEPEASAGVNHAYRLQAATDDWESFPARVIGWPHEGCRAFVKVGIIDTAIDTTMAEDWSATIRAASFGAKTPQANAPTTAHGTALAALIVGEGRLRDVDLYNAVVIHADSETEAAGVDDLMQAFDWLADEGVRIVNISLAGPYNKILDRGIQRVAAQGMVIVAAAGNDGPKVDPRYPAAFRQVVAVTAVDADLRIYRKAVRGAHIDIAAPGVDVAIPLKGGYRVRTGTSFAVPFVTAQLASDERWRSAAHPETILPAALMETALDLGEEGHDEVYGAGLLSARESCGL
ncbi:possible protease [Parvularcula bermudensis HTCC2503]|uniref:Possible protease n=1 Tax=Parvularcula bermudensis (strain ATCC BAA-594 / HTCC2503 / KCTC 12087) TaxID=314260 RepID=E0TDF5_PARBH|nr:S8 family serine peptidase [Parvularcula bermudensis]ADM10381.1 possible protease [Parvularcula bermudensis HTCC2503]